MALPDSHLLDEYATAFVAMLAAGAGATIASSRLDYGVDGTLKPVLVLPSGGYAETGFPVDFQIKGTTTAEFSPQEVSYDLAIRSYNLILARPADAVPYYLFLVCFPASHAEWVEHRAGKLIVNAAAFWWTDQGDASTNRSHKRIRVPMANVLNRDAISRLLSVARKRYSR